MHAYQHDDHQTYMIGMLVNAPSIPAAVSTKDIFRSQRYQLDVERSPTPTRFATLVGTFASRGCAPLLISENLYHAMLLTGMSSVAKFARPCRAGGFLLWQPQELRAQ